MTVKVALCCWMLRVHAAKCSFLWVLPGPADRANSIPIDSVVCIQAYLVIIIIIINIIKLSNKNCQTKLNMIHNR